MTYEGLTDLANSLETTLKDIAQRLKTYPKGRTGLTYEHAKDKTWFRLKASYAHIHKRLQEVNKTRLKRYPTECKAERERRRENLKRNAEAVA